MIIFLIIIIKIRIIIIIMIKKLTSKIITLAISKRYQFRKMDFFGLKKFKKSLESLYIWFR